MYHQRKMSATTIAAVISLLSIILPFVVSAQTGPSVITKCGEGELCHPFFNLKGGLLELLGTMLQMIMGLVGVVSFVMVILGAVRWMTAGGNSESVEKGKGMIVWAFLGLALAAVSFAILDVFFQGLQKAFYKP
ncbi:MAG: hypothetical protein AB1352_02795 [Patescibacteria group bacterium]